MFYECKLRNKGVVQEWFYREAESAMEMRKSLAMYVWPVGKWTITRAVDDLSDLRVNKLLPLKIIKII